MNFIVFLILLVWVVGSGSLFVGLLYGLKIDVPKHGYFVVPIYLVFLIMSGSAFCWAGALFLKLIQS